jgi:hypothetical protein
MKTSHSVNGGLQNKRISLSCQPLIVPSPWRRAVCEVLHIARLSRTAMLFLPDAT